MTTEITKESLSLAFKSIAEDYNSLPFEVGEKYFIRTVTHYMVGKLIKITPEFLVFTDASWIADTGRFMDFLEKGEANEIEPVKGLYRVARNAIVDAFDWIHPLPVEQK